MLQEAWKAGAYHMEIKNQTRYHADFYLRISREDGDKGESDSITNQRDLLLGFLSSHPEISLHGERIDDGYSGVDFHRPEFNKMMETVKAGEINCIIVKDFSRLGRNFIETGKYIEKIFPFMGVRFISVNDHYDSLRPKTAAEDLLVPVKNLMNDAYCRDISIKIRSQLDIKRKKGQCIAPFAVYGYAKDPADKNQLIIDEQAAETVKDIFRRKLEGYSPRGIADWLNENGVLPPMEYKRFHGSRFSTSFRRKAASRWTAPAVLRILKNPVYMGTLVQGKRSTPNYKVKKAADLPPERWITVENSHEPIISKEAFEHVSDLLLEDTRTPPGGETVYPLSGLLSCKDCRRNMVRKNNAGKGKPYYYYICSGYKQKTGCASHSIRDRLAEDAVLIVVQKLTELLLDEAGATQAVSRLSCEERNVKKAGERLSALREEIKVCQRYQAHLYGDYQDRLICREDYQSLQQRYRRKIEEAEAAVVRIGKRTEGPRSKKTIKEQSCSDIGGGPAVIPARLDRLLAVKMIHHIEVCEGQRLQIEFRFRDEYALSAGGVAGDGKKKQSVC